jgi:hypothetical protein
MKRLILIAVAIIVSMSVYGQNIFFPTKEGTKLVYASLNAKGKVESHTKQTVLKVEGTENNMVISYVSQILDKNRKPMSEFPMEVPLSVTIADGALVLDMKTYAAPGTEGFIEIEGDKLKIPSTLAPGDRLEDVNFILTVNMGFKIKTEVLLTDQQCLAVEDVIVPAGTFKSYKITQTNHGTVMGRTVVTTMITWYAHGVGIVKTENYDKKNKLQSSMELIEIN